MISLHSSSNKGQTGIGCTVLYYNRTLNDIVIARYVNSNYYDMTAQMHLIAHHHSDACRECCSTRRHSIPSTWIPLYS